LHAAVGSPGEYEWSETASDPETQERGEMGAILRKPGSEAVKQGPDQIIWPFETSQIRIRCPR